ncbi:MAG: HPP family protein [Zoogloeaceae bacterium]|nr:HPP family protein [Zoogloeaceae bacterium]
MSASPRPVIPQAPAPVALPPAPALRFILISTVGAILAVGLTGWLTQTSGHVWQMAPFGATCVLAFGLPDSPLAQPRHIVGGHFVTAALGLLALWLIGDGWLSMAVATGLGLGAMQLLRVVHPPAGANPMVVIASHASAGFLITPVLAGSIAIVLVAVAVNNLRKRGSYPRYWL